MGAFRGQTAVVIGATGGVGQAIADRLIAAGAKTLLVARRRARLDELVQERGWDAASVECHAVDLGEESEVLKFGTKLRTAWPDVHVLVHAAGAITLGTLEGSRLSDLDVQYRVNLRAPYQLTQMLVPNLVHAAGQVVFINSSAGLSARPGIVQYSATKHALRAVADGLRDEINPRGVRVLSVFLGRTASRMQQAVHDHEQKKYQPERLLQPEDVASIVLSVLDLPRTAEVTDLHIRPMLKS